MSRSVGIAQLKAKLSAYLRRVKRGETVTVLDRDTPVAQLVPTNAASHLIRIRRARGGLRSLRLLPPLRTHSEIVALLLQERGES